MAPRGQQARDHEGEMQCLHIIEKLLHEFFVLLLQEMPTASGSIQPSTCRYVNCPHPDSVIPPGTHCVNLESRQCADANHFFLHYEPKAKLHKVKQSPKGRGGLYGLGKHGEERYCVGCLEKMVEEHRRRLQRKDPQRVFLEGHPIFEIAYLILGDQRVIPDRPGNFTLRSFKVYGVELWKARGLWNRRDANPQYVLRHVPGRTEMLEYIPGRYEKATYLQREDKRYRGLVSVGLRVSGPRIIVFGFMIRHTSS